MSGLTRQEIEQTNLELFQRHSNFRVAADWIAAELSRLPEVSRVVLFGSVAVPLKKEVPRFREYRRAGIEVWHETQDLDLAVWLSDLAQLPALKKAAAQALNRLRRESGTDVQFYLLDVFILEPGTDRYWGGLCISRDCPKYRAVQCNVPECGKPRFLRRFAKFSFDPLFLHPSRSQVLFDRGQAPTPERGPETPLSSEI